MRRAIIFGAIGLGLFAGPLSAQTVLWGDPTPQPQTYPYPDPQTIYPQPEPLYPQPTYPQPQTVYPQPQPRPQPPTVYPQPLPAPQPVYPAEPAPQAQPVDTTPKKPRPIGKKGKRRDRAPTMAEELDALITTAERYRAASPGFLEDLKALSERYREPAPRGQRDDAEITLDPAPAPAQPAPETPEVAARPLTPGPVEPEGPSLDEPGVIYRGDGNGALNPQPTPTAPETTPEFSSVVYLADDFTDGDFDANPTWFARQGEWRVDPQNGLRPVQPEQQGAVRITPTDLLQVLLGGEAPVRGQGAEARAALIEAPIQIGNAFSMTALVTDHAGEGAAHFIMHQGGANWLGYRLEIRGGARPLMVLTRRGASGYKDIMKVEATGYVQGRPNEIRWARLSDGRMIVVLNGQPLITARDTVFQDPWSGFAIFNAASDVSVRKIRIAAPIER